MAYTVIARRWRPQTLDQVVGQRHVTQTLRNAFGSGRIAQAFVFAGPRGVGKTTTARILARMLNCDQGPTADPCGKCDACHEIAEGRDMDVLEIDAATHTQVENIREVIIAGLSTRPVRDRYKVFIIDEVHQLSNHSFNALLKSIEEPPPHVAFIMATTAPDKIPDTIVSRSQVFEFKTIASRGIAEQLQKIADADGITVSNEAIALVARAAEGSMRDAETAFDQVLAFAGNTVTVDDVATVLGLVGRDLLFDMVTAVADEDGTQAFELAGRAVEAGYDLRLLCRETSRLVRDLLLLKVDATRMNDADVAPEPDRERLSALLPRFSQEDLLRAFDLLSKAEYDIRNATEPRYQLEMALLRWIHLRKLTPLSTLVEQLSAGSGLSVGGRPSGGGLQPPSVGSRPAAAPSRPAPASSASVAKRLGSTAPAAAPPGRPVAPPPASKPAAAPPATAPAARALRVAEEPNAGLAAPAAAVPVSPDAFVSAYRDLIRAERPTVGPETQVALEGDRVVFRARAFLTSRLAKDRAWLESAAQRVAGRKLAVVFETIEGTSNGEGGTGAATAVSAGSTKDDLMAAARANPAVQTVLEIFPAEVKDVTELK